MVNLELQATIHSDSLQASSLPQTADLKVRTTFLLMVSGG